MPRRLIINADDFGLTEGVSLGIVDAIQRGVVTATTAMVAVPDAGERVARLAPRIAGRVGLHLQLTGGAPCLPPDQVPSLVAGDGAFPRKRPDIVAPRRDELEREFRAQVARLRALGVAPTHLDSHHHVHTLPAVLPAYLAIARELGVPARGGASAINQALRDAGVVCAARTETAWFGGDLTPTRLARIVRKAFGVLGDRGDTVELMCHPAQPDAALAAVSSYTAERGHELAVLCDPDTAALLAGFGVELIAPAQLGSISKMS